MKVNKLNAQERYLEIVQSELFEIQWVHRSYAVNLSIVTRLDDHAVYVGEEVISVSQLYQKELNEHFLTI